MLAVPSRDEEGHGAACWLVARVVWGANVGEAELGLSTRRRVALGRATRRTVQVGRSGDCVHEELEAGVSTSCGSALRSRKTLTRTAAAARSGESSPERSSINASAGKGLVGVEEEHGEKRTRLASAQGYLAALVPHLERSQDPELQLASRPRGADSWCWAGTDRVDIGLGRGAQ